MKKIATILAMLASAAICGAQVPTLLNYQGYLQDASGNPATGTVNIAIALYTNATTGASVYSETIGAVTLDKGVYSFFYGTNEIAMANALTNSMVWMQLSLNGSALSPRQRIVSVPYARSAGTISESSFHETTGELLGMVMDLQTKLVQIQAGQSPGTTAENFITDAFTDINGINNSVVTSLTTSAYSSPSYLAASIYHDPTEYGPNAYIFWVLIKNYTNINSLVKQVTTETYLDTQVYILYTYSDATTWQSGVQSGGSWATLSFTNAQQTKTVSSVAVYAQKPTSLGNNSAHVRNTKIVKHQTVEVVIDLSPFGNSISAAELNIDASRQTGDAISYAICNSSVTNSGLALSVKNAMPSPVAQPARLHISLSPAAIQNFVLGSTALKAFTVRLW